MVHRLTKQQVADGTSSRRGGNQGGSQGGNQNNGGTATMTRSGGNQGGGNQGGVATGNRATRRLQKRLALESGAAQASSGNSQQSRQGNQQGGNQGNQQGGRTGQTNQTGRQGNQGNQQGNQQARQGGQQARTGSPQQAGRQGGQNATQSAAQSRAQDDPMILAFPGATGVPSAENIAYGLLRTCIEREDITRFRRADWDLRSRQVMDGGDSLTEEFARFGRERQRRTGRTTAGRGGA